MNRCKQCNKEIDDRHTFCSSSCSAKYSNARRGKFHWHLEAREAYSKRAKLRNDQKRIAKGEKALYDEEGNRQPGTCYYCGKELGVKERTVCSECRQYSKMQSLPKRLGFQTGTFKERYEETIRYLSEMYLSGESLLTLSQKFDIPKETLWYNLKRAGIVRTLSESGKVAALSGRLKPESNKKFKHGWHRSWEGFEGYYRSSYELEYACQLDNQKISYRMEYIPTFTVYWDSQTKTRRVAKPDFYLPDTNEIVEIKSQYTYDEQNMRDRFEAYRGRGFVPRLILEGKEIEI